MPLYEFECEACERRFERIQKFSDPNPAECPTCGKGPVKRLPSSPAIQFKGSGFYITDYAKKSSPEASSTKSGGSDKGASDKSSTSDTKSGDSGAAASSPPASTDSGSKSSDKS